jgi:hypothetical protein
VSQYPHRLLVLSLLNVDVQKNCLAANGSVSVQRAFDALGMVSEEPRHIFNIDFVDIKYKKSSFVE